jgi:hypothetical protein
MFSVAPADCRTGWQVVDAAGKPVETLPDPVANPLSKLPPSAEQQRLIGDQAHRRI